MQWYKNYLASEVQPWARQVQKEIDNVKANFQSAEVNNVKRDDQLASSLRQVQSAANAASDASTQATAAAAQANTAATNALAAANTANTSLNGLVSLGTDGSSYSVHGGNITANTITANEINSGYVYAGQIDADQINAGTLTGFTIQTGSSGARSVLAGQNIAFYNSDNTSAGIITGNGPAGAVVNGVNVIANQTLHLQGTGITLNSTTQNVTIPNGSLILSTGGINAGQIQGSSVSTGSITCTNNVGAGSVTSTNDIIAGTPLINGAIIRRFLENGGTTGASFTNSGALVRTSSSERYKTDIQLLNIDLNDLYELEPKTFKRIEEVEEDGESARTYPGFIAEELAGTSLDKFVFYSQDEDGNPRPEGIHYPELTAALLLAIKDLNARIQALENTVQ
jgi:hypothetical protein